jgi:hypothetical protein
MVHPKNNDHSMIGNMEPGEMTRKENNDSLKKRFVGAIDGTLKINPTSKEKPTIIRSIGNTALDHLTRKKKSNTCSKP